MGDSLESGTGDGPPEAENVAIVEYSTFATFLKKAVTILLPEDEDVIPPALNSALNDRNNQECIHKFLSDPQVSCLFVQRISSKGRFNFLLFNGLDKFTLCLTS
jgi:dynein heavy chain 1